MNAEKKNFVEALRKITKIVIRSNTTCLWHTCYDPAAKCMSIWVVLCPFFHRMQTAVAEEDINENTVASGRREKKEIKKEKYERE